MASATCGLPAGRSGRADTPRVVDADQPPQGGVDTSEVPEVGIASVRIDVFGDLPVAGLFARQCIEAVDRALFERRVAAAHIASTQTAASRPKMRV